MKFKNEEVGDLPPYLDGWSSCFTPSLFVVSYSENLVMFFSCPTLAVLSCRTDKRIKDVLGLQENHITSAMRAV